MKPAVRQQGVALITVLLVVAIVVVVASSMALRQQLGIRAASNQQLSRQAWHYALAAEYLASELLAQDHLQEKVPIDHLGEAWAEPQQVTLDGDVQVRFRIEDLAGRFNLNGLQQGAQSNPDELARFRHLLALLELPTAYAERLGDWLDADAEPLDGGAEDLEYLQLDPPYRTPGQPLQDVSELRLLLEMTDADYRKLAPYVSALPGTAALNLNTASAPVLASLADNLTPEQTANAIAVWPLGGIAAPAVFLALPEIAGTELEGARMGVNSEHFLVHIEVRLGDFILNLSSHLQRKADRIRTLSRRLGQTPYTLRPTTGDS